MTSYFIIKNIFFFLLIIKEYNFVILEHIKKNSKWVFLKNFINAQKTQNLPFAWVNPLKNVKPIKEIFKNKRQKFKLNMIFFIFVEL